MPLPKVKLVSDFMDYYDHWFDKFNTTWRFERSMVDPHMPRSRALDLMDKVGCYTPCHGTLDYVSYQYGTPDEKYVVYYDEFAHAGEKKKLVYNEAAQDMHGSFYASRYVPLPKDIIEAGWSALSYRVLVIGDNNHFTICYASKNSWMSNVDSDYIEVVNDYQDDFFKILCHFDQDQLAEYAWKLRPYLKYNPIYAVDFVIGHNENPNLYTIWAVDLNTSPGIKGSGVEEFKPAKEIVTDIKIFIQENWT